MRQLGGECSSQPQRAQGFRQLFSLSEVLAETPLTSWFPGGGAAGASGLGFRRPAGRLPGCGCGGEPGVAFGEPGECVEPYKLLSGIRKVARDPAGQG